MKGRHKIAGLLLAASIVAFVAFALGRAPAKAIIRGCEEFDAAAREIYAQENQNWSPKKRGAVNHPAGVLALSDQYREKKERFLNKAKADPASWIKGVEQYLLRKAKRRKNDQSFLWKPYVTLALDAHPKSGQWSIFWFVNECQGFPTRDLVDFLSALTAARDWPGARDAVDENDLARTFDRLLLDVSPSYDYFHQMPTKIGGFDLDTGIDHPNVPGRIIASSLRACDWGCILAYEWFRPQGFLFDEFKFVEATPAVRDQIIARMRKCLAQRPNDGEGHWDKAAFLWLNSR